MKKRMKMKRKRDKNGNMDRKTKVFQESQKT